MAELIKVDYNPFESSAAPLTTADISSLAEEEGAPLELVRSVYEQETSSGRNVKTSTAGARGPFQVMPATFASVMGGQGNIDDPRDNARAGIRLLAQLSKRYGGDHYKAAAAYFSGEGNVNEQGIVEDRADTNGKRVSDYAREVSERAGARREAPAVELVKVDQPPVFPDQGPDPNSIYLVPPQPEEQQPAQPEGPGFFKETGRGLAHGGLTLAEAVNLGGQFIAGRIGNKEAQEFFSAGAKFWERIGKGYEPPEELQGNILDKPELLGKAAWWGYNVADMVPSLAASIIPGLGAYRGIKVAGTALQLTPVVIARLARVGAMIAGGTAGGSLEGVQTYKTVLERGGTEGEAAGAGTMMALASAALNAISIGALTGPAQSRIMAFVKDGVTEGLTEWAEEPAEGAILSSTSVAKPEDEPLSRAREGINVLPIAAVLGGGAGAITHQTEQAPGQQAPSTVPMTGILGGQQPPPPVTPAAPAAPAGHILVPAETTPQFGDTTGGSRETVPPDPETPTFPMMKGAAGEAATERGLKIGFDYAVVEASSLKPSHTGDLSPNPEYPQQLQPRQRDRAASEAQITRIAADLKPELLGDSPLASMGAPVIGRDAIVESGNARSIALARAYAEGKASGYRDWLTRNATRFGIEPDAIAPLKEPVLVRVRNTPVDRVEFARQANEPAVATMSAAETAKADAARLDSLEGLQTDENGVINIGASQDFLRRFVAAAVAPAEQGTVVDAQGQLSQAGLARVRNAVFAKAYGDPELVQMMTESTDVNVRNILHGLTRAAPAVASMRSRIASGDLHDLDITPHIARAVREFSVARSRGESVERLLAQGELLGSRFSPETVEALKAIEAHSRSGKQIAEFLHNYVAAVEAQGSPRQGQLIEQPTPAIAPSLEQAAKRTGERYEEGGGPGAAAVEPVEPGGTPAPRRADAGEVSGAVQPGRAAGSQPAVAADDLERPEREAAVGPPPARRLRVFIGRDDQRDIEFEDEAHRSIFRLAALERAMGSGRKPYSDANVALATRLREQAGAFLGLTDDKAISAAALDYRSAVMARARATAPGSLVPAGAPEGHKAAEDEVADALAQLGEWVDAHLPGKAAMLPLEARDSLIQILAKLFAAAIKKGFKDFKSAARWVLEKIRNDAKLAALVDLLPEEDLKASYQEAKKLAAAPPPQPVMWPGGVPAGKPSAAPKKHEIPESEVPLNDEQKAVEKRFREYVINNFEAVIAEYRKRFGLLVSADEARELSPDYAASKENRSKFAVAVHEPSSYIAKEVYRRILAEPVPDGKQAYVIFTAGGTGAGKTSGIRDVAGLAQISSDANATYDTNMNNARSAKAKIEQALEAQRDVIVIMTYRDPVDALKGGTLPRAMKRGRTVTLQTHAETHEGALRSVLTLAEDYKGHPRVRFYVLDNSHGAGNALEMTLDELKAKPHTVDKEQLRHALEAEFQAGRISETVYRATLGQQAPIGQREAGRGGQAAGQARPAQPEQERREVTTHQQWVAELEERIAAGDANADLIPDHDVDAFSKAMLDAGWTIEGDEKRAEFVKDGWYLWLRPQGKLAPPIAQWGRSDKPGKTAPDSEARWVKVGTTMSMGAARDILQPGTIVRQGDREGTVQPWQKQDGDRTRVRFDGDPEGVSALLDGRKLEFREAQTIDAAAHEAAASPKNGKRPPSPFETKAGNYEKGHDRIGGLPVAIENPEGSWRFQFDLERIGRVMALLNMGFKYPAQQKSAEAGLNDLRMAIEAFGRAEPVEGRLLLQDAAKTLRKEHADLAGIVADVVEQGWHTLMQAHYGYFNRTEDRTGEQVDVFIKPGTPRDYNGPVFIVDQGDAKGAHDEYKVMVGWATEVEARAAYRAHYPPDWDRIRGIREMTFDDFKQWLASDGATSIMKRKEPKRERTAGKGSAETGDESRRAQSRAARPADSGQMGFWMAGEGEGAGGERPAAGPAEGTGQAGTGNAVGRPGGGGEQRPAGQRPAGPARHPDGTLEKPDHSGTLQAEPVNYTITPADKIGEGGAKTKARGNIAAIRIVKDLTANPRPASPEEQAMLARYVGWGGIKQLFDEGNAEWAKEREELKALLTAEEFDQARRSVLDAHYTALNVVAAMYDAVKRLGFNGGRVLEPAMGTGNFFGMMPAEMRTHGQLVGVELEPITGAIAKLLYPKADIAAPRGFQEFAVPEGFFDLAIGNPPFGKQTLYDPANKDLGKFSIHNFFFAKSVKSLRPGGVLAMVVSNYFMDARAPAARQWIAKRAKLLGAIRLPNKTFMANAGTEVTTDIVFLQKLKPGEEADASWAKVGEIPDPEGGEPIALNQYFIDHPDMLLGQMKRAGTMYGPGQPALIGPVGAELDAAMAKALSNLPEGVYVPEQRKVEDLTESLVPDTVRVGGYFFLPDGKLARRKPDMMDKAQHEVVEPPSEMGLERIRGMVKVRDALMRLMRAEVEDKPGLMPMRQALNTTYDAFVKKYGYLNSLANRRAFQEDPDAPRLEALEKDYDPGISKEVAQKLGIEPRKPTAKKADIFTQRVRAPYVAPTKADTPQDALSASLAERGAVDLDYMAQLAGQPAETLTKALEGVLYEDPERGWVTADEYLSGNVKAKLAAAKKRAEADPRFRVNVLALEKVQPADVDPTDIYVRFGSHWIDAKDYGDFIESLLGVRPRTMQFIPAVSRWTVDIPSKDTTAFTSEWGAVLDNRDGWNAARIMEAMLNNKPIVVKKNIGTPAEPKYITLEAETEAARVKADAIQEKFRGWLFADAARRDRLSRVYNDTFNTDVEREYNGAHLTLPGTNPAIQLTENKKHSAWRIIQTPNTLLDHVVGSGKTFTIAAAIMEMRRLGIVRKAMVVVPNHIVRQWRDEWYALYPGANILATTEDDFKKENRQRLFARVTTGNWDAVIVAHSSFEKVPMPEALASQILNEQITDLVEAIKQAKAAAGDKFAIRDMERMVEKLKEKMKARADVGGKDKAGVDFSELGIDALAVDELHEYKNLYYFSQMQGVAGMGDRQGSNKAFDMFVKMRSLQLRGGKVIGATGTPVSNSLVEMFNMQRYMDYDALRARGVHHVDAWAGVYGDIRQVWEVHPSGTGYRLSNRLAKLTNLPELITQYRKFADVLTLADLKQQFSAKGKRYPVPKVKGGKPQVIVAPRSPEQVKFFGTPEFERDQDGNIAFKLPGKRSEYSVAKDEKSGKFYVQRAPGGTERPYRIMHDPHDTEQAAWDAFELAFNEPIVRYNEGSILWKYENLKTLMKESEGKINALSITNEARKGGLDYRIIEPAAEDFANTKTNKAVAEIVRIYKQWESDKGTQLVFIDLSTPKGEKAEAAAEDEPGEVNMDELLASQGGGKFSVYDDLKAKLVASGIPAGEIAFIHSAKSQEAKRKLFARVNRGEVRVLMGSTKKMGAGTNVQKRLVAEHHLDVPWRPSDLEQREGRIIRQGNALYERDPEGFEVELMRYATEKSYDTRMWQIVEHKAAAIEQLRSGLIKTREIEDVAGEAANAADMKAAASGNPLLEQEIKLRDRVKKLTMAQDAFRRTKYALERHIQTLPVQAKYLKDEAERLSALQAAVQPKPKDGFVYTDPKGKAITEHDKLADPLVEAMKAAVAKSDHQIPAGEYRGLTVHVEHSRLMESIRVYLSHGKGTSTRVTEYGKEDKLSAAGFLQRLDNFIAGIPAELASNEKRAEANKAELEKAKREAKEDFPQESELADTRAKHVEILQKLQAAGGAVELTPEMRKELEAARKARNDGKLSRNPGNLWYSQLARVVERKMAGAEPADVIRQKLTDWQKGGAFRADELEWSGLLDWLATQTGRVPKEAVLAFLDANGVRVEETVLTDEGLRRATAAVDRLREQLDALGYSTEEDHEGLIGIRRRDDNETFTFFNEGLGGDWGYANERGLMAPYRVNALALELGRALEESGQTMDARDRMSGTRYSEYTLPGGENYRELLLRLPTVGPEVSPPNLQEWLKKHPELADEANAGGARSRAVMDQFFADPETKAQSEKLRRQALNRFTHPHFSEFPNYVAHVRFKERTDSAGRKVLFLEEIQSDWAQSGRKFGFRTAAFTPEAEARFNELSNKMKEVGKRGMTEAERKEITNLDKLYMDAVRDRNRPPSAPFVKSTKAWVSLVLKRMILWAAHNDFDAIAWTTGEQQVERYDLAQHLEAVNVHRRSYDPRTYDLYIVPKNARPGQSYEAIGVDEDKLADNVGEELAAKIKADPQADQAYSGLDLRFGGEGMRKFYDSIVPDVARDVLRRLGGGEVQQIDVDLGLTANRQFADDMGMGWDEDAARDLNEAAGYFGGDADIVGSDVSGQPGFELTDALRARALEGLPLFSRSAMPVMPGMAAGEVRALSDQLLRGRKNAPRVFVWQNYRAAPKPVRDFIRDRKAEYNGAAAFIGQQVHVFADNLADRAHAQFAILHELTHFGLRGVFGDALDQLLTRIHDDNADVRAAVERYRKDDPELSIPEAVEEVLADMGGRKQTPSWFGAIVAAVRDFLRRHGWYDGALSDNDIRNIVRRALNYSKNRPAAGFVSVFRAPALSRTRSAWIERQAAPVQEALRKAGVWHEETTLKQRVADWSKDWKKRFRQGIFDQFDPIKEYDYKAYMHARLTRGADAALEALLNYGTIYLDADGAVDVRNDGGFLKMLAGLNNEHERFMAWVIGNRAERLLAEGREHNFTPDDVARLKSLNQGRMTDGRDRATQYRAAALQLDRYNRSVVDIAQRAGLVDAVSRPLWEKDFYIPFYRVMDEALSIGGPKRASGLVNQYAFKVLKGGAQEMGDPLQNVLRNWAHLIDASLKNQAARESLTAASNLGAAIEAPEETARQMAKAMKQRDAVVSFTDQGVKRWFVVEDAFLLDALRSIGFVGFGGPGMKVMQNFKRWLTLGVTISPTFRIRNVIRDSLAMIGTNPASYNVLSNVLTGWRNTREGSVDFGSILAGGGVMRYGTTLEGDRAEHVKRMIQAGIQDRTVLDTDEKIKAALRSAWDWWQHIGDRAENVNRAALYKTLRAQGKSHLEASFASRDVIDFSMQGTWAAIRFLTQTVPFMNARLQGLYKLGRGAKQDPTRFGVVLGAVALASIALLLSYKDDEDWKKREDWDRETYWWFKIGNTAYRIPKPFEIGSIATLAERGLETMITQEMTGRDFADRVFNIIWQQLNMNPVPQIFAPALELWANKDLFTDRPIETAGMERLSRSERIGPNTSAFAKGIGQLGVWSPVQVDHLVNGYFGWLGTHLVASADLALRPWQDKPRPAARINELFVVGDFVQELPAYQSRYVTRLYTQGQKYQEALADLRHYAHMGDKERTREILQEQRTDLMLGQLYTRGEAQLAKVNARILSVQQGKLDPVKKRAELDRLYKLRNQAAQLIEETARKIQRQAPPR